MAKFKFKDLEVEYDEAYIKGYSMEKALARGDKDPAGLFGALEKLYKGKDDEYAEALGYDTAAMLEMLSATFENAGSLAKN